MAMDWNERKAQQKKLKEAEKIARFMSQSVSRAESASRDEVLLRNVASVALAIEALETLLVEKGLLKDNEVMDRLTLMTQPKETVDAT